MMMGDHATSNVFSALTSKNNGDDDDRPVEFPLLTEEDVRDFCQSYNFATDNQDGVENVVKLYLCDLRKKILDAGIPQNECFVMITTDLLTTLGFDRPWKQMEAVHDYCNRAPNLFSNNIVPWENVRTDPQTTPGKYGYSLPDWLDEGTLILSALQNSHDSDPNATIVRCGYVFTCIIPIRVNDADFIQTPMGMVLDFDVGMAGNYNFHRRGADRKRVIQMFDIQPLAAVIPVVKYAKTLAMVIDATSHNGTFVSVLVEANGPLSQEELFGAVMTHRRDLRRVSEEAFDGISMVPVHVPSTNTKMTFWPFHYDTTANNDHDCLSEEVVDDLLQNSFNHPEKQEICLWLAMVWEKMMMHSGDPRKSYVVLTNDHVHRLRKVAFCDNAPFAYDATSLLSPNNAMKSLISFIKPAADFFMLSAFFTDAGEVAFIVNPLTYLPEGPDVFLFNVENLFKLFRFIFCANEFDRKPFGHRAYVADYPVKFSDFVQALTDPDNVGGQPLSDAMSLFKVKAKEEEKAAAAAE